MDEGDYSAVIGEKYAESTDLRKHHKTNLVVEKPRDSRLHLVLVYKSCGCFYAQEVHPINLPLNLFLCQKFLALCIPSS